MGRDHSWHERISAFVLEQSMAFPPIVPLNANSASGSLLWEVNICPLLTAWDPPHLFHQSQQPPVRRTVFFSFRDSFILLAQFRIPVFYLLQDTVFPGHGKS